MAKKNIKTVKHLPKKAVDTAIKTIIVENTDTLTDEVVSDDLNNNEDANDIIANDIVESATTLDSTDVETLNTIFNTDNVDGAVLGDDSKDMLDGNNTYTETKTEAIKKAKRTKLGANTTSIIAGCSYHYFRKYFKKKYAAEDIKVRFVKTEIGYNGHVEVAEADREKAISLLLKIKTDNVDVKNLFWFV